MHREIGIGQGIETMVVEVVDQEQTASRWIVISNGAVRGRERHLDLGTYIIVYFVFPIYPEGTSLAPRGNKISVQHGCVRVF